MPHLKKAFVVLAAVVLAPSGWSQDDSRGARDHTVLTAADVTWGEGLASLPPGAKSALLDGDPKKEGVFVLRLKLPAGYRMPPHWHPVDERVTIVSGALRLGIGDAFDAAKTRLLPAGSFYSLPPKASHFSLAVEETVMQISTTGPWALTYVRPEDDPRKTK